MTAVNRESGTPVDFAEYIGGLYGLDARVGYEGNAVIKASQETVRSVGEEIADRGYEVRIEAETYPYGIVVVPSEADLRAVGKPWRMGSQKPARGLR